MLDGRADRFRLTGNWLIFQEIRMQLLELSYLTIRAPAQITAFSVLQVSAGNFFEPASCIEPCGNFVGNSFILYKPIRVRLADGVFIELLRVEQTAFDTGDLSPSQCSTIFEILSALLGPDIVFSFINRHTPQTL